MTATRHVRRRLPREGNRLICCDGLAIGATARIGPGSVGIRHEQGPIALVPSPGTLMISGLAVDRADEVVRHRRTSLKDEACRFERVERHTATSTCLDESPT